jgi:hypothetical protein
MYVDRMHGSGCFLTSVGDRYEGLFHNDRFLNQHGYWVPVQEQTKLNTPPQGQYT